MPIFNVTIGIPSQRSRHQARGCNPQPLKTEGGRKEAQTAQKTEGLKMISPLRLLRFFAAKSSVIIPDGTAMEGAFFVSFSVFCGQWITVLAP
jgi:hypothetical protein